MNKKSYSSPECEVIKLKLHDALLASPLNPNDPQDPTRAGDEGGGVDDPFAN